MPRGHVKRFITGLRRINRQAVTACGCATAEHREDRLNDARTVQPGVGIHLFQLAWSSEGIRKHNRQP